jgi:hypothetical protein
MNPVQPVNPALLHQFENYYTLTIPDVIILCAVLGIGLLLIFLNKAPRISSIREFVNLLNSRGGNILALLILSIYFFSATMRLFYHALWMITSKQLDPQNAVLMMALQFCTATAFGASFGSMLKTMTGSDGQSRAGDAGPTEESQSDKAAVQK